MNCPFYHIVSRLYPINMAGTIDGNLDHLTEGGLAKFLHCLVIPPALSTKLSLGERVLEEAQPMLKEWEWFTHC